MAASNTDEDRVALEHFMQQSDQDGQRGRHLVIVDECRELNSATSFSQYTLNGRLITMIGELHDVSWECPNSPVSISDYVIGSVTRSGGCQVMLELNDYMLDVLLRHVKDTGEQVEPDVMGSEAIREIIVGLFNAGRHDAIRPVDWRSFFLTPRGQHLLYNVDWAADGSYEQTAPSSSNYNPETIGNQFIEPYFAKQRADGRLFSIHVDDYDPNAARFLVDTYVPKLERNFTDTANLLRQVPTTTAATKRLLDKVQARLKDNWKEVMDFFVLRELLKTRGSDEVVIILGDMHYRHMQPIIRRFATIIGQNQTDKRAGRCVKLAQTYRF